MSSNAAAVSYNNVARKRDGDMSSKDVPYRHFNNHVKKTLIQASLDAVKKESPSLTGVNVLDIASGRGGDIGKWLYMQSPKLCKETSHLPRASVLKATHYEGFDVSAESVAEAQHRYDTFGSGIECTASFSVADCFSFSFLDTLRQHPRFGKFNMVSIQFALHYACGDEALLGDLLATVAESLAVGGVFLVTTVNPAELARRVASGDLSNSLYKIVLASDTPEWREVDGQQLLATGTQYHFQLDGFVDCPEYVVPLDYIADCCSKHGLESHPQLSMPFCAFLPEYEASWHNNKGNVLSAEERALVTLYHALFYVKK